MIEGWVYILLCWSEHKTTWRQFVTVSPPNMCRGFYLTWFWLCWGIFSRSARNGGGNITSYFGTYMRSMMDICQYAPRRPHFLSTYQVASIFFLFLGKMSHCFLFFVSDYDILLFAQCSCNTYIGTYLLGILRVFIAYTGAGQIVAVRSEY